MAYKVNPDGNALVTQTFHLTNLSEYFHIFEYVTDLSQKEIYNLKAYDITGPLPVTFAKKDPLPEARVVFKAPVVGVNQTYNWSLSYETPGIAKKNGRLWEIKVLKPGVTPEVTNFSLGLYLPDTFGKNLYLKPKATANGNLWAGNDFSSNVILGAYDPQNEVEAYQAYDFKLVYQIQNPKLYPVTLNLALPPDSPYQKSYITSISPKPINVASDGSGNWLASYHLGPAENLEVKVTGSATVFPQPTFDTQISSQGFLDPQKYWESSDPQIKALAEKITTPAEIYKFVSKTLDKDIDKNLPLPARLGAKASLTYAKNYSAQDFADLFVTLCRAANIPARVVFGFYEGNPHVWAEYYEHQWKAVDLMLAKISGGNDYFSSFDFKHLALGSYGKTSTLPNVLISPKAEISYRKENLDLFQNPKLGLRVDAPKEITSGFPGNGRVFVENYGPTSFAGKSVTLRTGKFMINNPFLPTGKLLPFSVKSLDFSLDPISWNISQNDIITLEFAGETREYEVTSSPFFQNKFILTVGSLFTLGIVSLFAQIARSLLIPKPKR